MFYRRAVTITCFVVALVVAGAPTGAAARHRHHHHRSPELQNGTAQDAAQQALHGERVSPNPRAASMRQSEDALHRVLASGPVADIAATPGALRDPKNRVQVTASLASATLPRPELAGFRHRDGGYGWVGPVFWPFASYDLFDAALWGDSVDASVWGYGAPDLTSGLFGIYPDDAVTAYARYLPASSASSPQPSVLTRMCGDATSEIAGVPAETVRSALQLDDDQHAALDNLAAAITKASQQIAASCPETLPLTARQRLTAMGDRLGAMVAAIDIVQGPLTTFFDKLNDTQKAQFVAFGGASPPAAPANPNPTQPSPTQAAPAAASVAPPTPAAQACAAANVTLSWPGAALVRAVGTGDAAKKALDGLQAAVTAATGKLAATCQPADATTPPARLAAIRTRLDAMRGALGAISAAVDPVYAALDPVETVDFDAVGSEPVRAMVMAATMQRFRALQQPVSRVNRRAWEARAVAAGSSAPADVRPADATSTEARPTEIRPAETQSAEAEATPAAHHHRHGVGRRHYAHAPNPVRAVGRVLGALLP